MPTRELYRTPKFDLHPDTRWCSTNFGGYNPLPHGPEMRTVHAEIIVNVSTPNDLTEKDWNTVKECTVQAGEIGIAAAAAVMAATESTAWDAAIAAFGESFGVSFESGIADKFDIEIAKSISSKIDTEEFLGEWTHH